MLASCRKNYCPDPTPIYVYKTVADYSSKVSVKLSDDKAKIVQAPGPNDIQHSSYETQYLVQGYLLNGICCGQNLAFLSIDKADYATWPLYPGADSLYKLIIDFDPLVVSYYNCGEKFLLDLDNGGIDTAQINQIIKDGELDKYFTKLK
jgi:hypothetical protein